MTKDKMSMLTRAHLPRSAPSPTASAGASIVALQHFLLSDLSWCETSTMFQETELIPDGAIIKFFYIYSIKAL